MDALAPAALALTVAFDVAATNGLVLIAYSGPFVRAMLPMTPDVRLDIAAGMADLVAASLLRCCCAMVPLLGAPAVWNTAGLIISATAAIGMTAWMSVKAALAYDLSADRLLVVQDTGVTLYTPTLLAADLLAIFMSWFVFCLIWVNRNVIKQLTVTEAALQAHSGGLWPYSRTTSSHHYAAVLSWLDSSVFSEPAEEPAEEPALGLDEEQPLQAPLLQHSSQQHHTWGSSSSSSGSSGQQHPTPQQQSSQQQGHRQQQQQQQQEETQQRRHCPQQQQQQQQQQHGTQHQHVHHQHVQQHGQQPPPQHEPGGEQAQNQLQAEPSPTQPDNHNQQQQQKKQQPQQRRHQQQQTQQAAHHACHLSQHDTHQHQQQQQQEHGQGRCAAACRQHERVAGTPLGQQLQLTAG